MEYYFLYTVLQAQPSFTMVLRAENMTSEQKNMLNITIWIILRLGAIIRLFCLLCSLCLGSCLCSPFCPFVCLLPSKLLSQNPKILIQNNNKNDRCQNRVLSADFASIFDGKGHLNSVSTPLNPLPDTPAEIQDTLSKLRNFTTSVNCSQVEKIVTLKIKCHPMKRLWC